MAVEVGALDADETDFAAHEDAAAAAHAGAVDHDRVERNEGRDAEGLRRRRAELHHDRRADRDHAVGRVRALAQLLERRRHERFAAVGAVVRADDHLVRRGAHALFENEQLLGPRGQNARHVVAGGLHRLGDRVDRRHADAAAAQHDAAEFPHFAGHAQRAERVGERVADAEARQLHGRSADRLEDDGHGAGLFVRVRDGERDAFAEVVVDLDDEELAGLVLAGDVGGFESHFPHVGGKLFFEDDLVHGHGVAWSGAILGKKAETFNSFRKSLGNRSGLCYNANERRPTGPGAPAPAAGPAPRFRPLSHRIGVLP